MQEVQAALREEVESVGRFAYLRVAFPEHTLEPGLLYCIALVGSFIHIESDGAGEEETPE